MHPASGYSNVAYATTSGRPEYCANYNPALQDYSFDPLSVSGSNFSMSNHDHASISSYASQDFTRHWPPTSSNKSMPNGVLFDQEGQPKYNHSTLPYLNSSVGTVSATLDGPPFPGMGSLATSLPNPVLKSSRVLPNPAANPVLSNPNGATGAHQGVMGDPSPLWSQPSGLKSTAPWGPESMGSQGSSSSSSSSTLTGSGGNKSSTPSSDAHENTFGYTIPLTQSPSSTISATTSEYNVGDSSTPGSVEEHLASDASIYPHGLSGGSLLGSHDASTNLYGYGAVGSTKRGSVAEASGTLLSSGRLYKHLPQSQHQQIGSLSMEHRDSLDPSSRNTVRKSISSVSNSRRY
ncbi:hypothetical protein MMC20_007588 [Loxospora ochrophaea]|nr:hypothetical protein [Loxospora ochrophaea]